MTTSVYITCVLIVIARIADVTIDTIRTASIIQGRRRFAAILGFFEAVIYISVVAKVLLNMNHPVYAIAYGTGFACGTFLGIVIEQHLAFGDQVISLFTRKGKELYTALADAGYRLAQVTGHVRDGDLAILHVEVPRKRSRNVIQYVSAIDADCFCIINDVRMAKYLSNQTENPSHHVSLLRFRGLVHLKR